jgi:hypothetical protein
VNKPSRVLVGSRLQKLGGNEIVARVDDLFQGTLDRLAAPGGRLLLNGGIEEPNHLVKIGGVGKCGHFYVVSVDALIIKASNALFLLDRTS